MEGAQQDDEEDHLEERDEEVGGGEGEAKDSENGGSRALEDRHSQCVERGTDPLRGTLALLGHVVVADVGGKVHGETDAHDQVDQRHAVQSEEESQKLERDQFYFCVSVSRSGEFRPSHFNFPFGAEIPRAVLKKNFCVSLSLI